MISQGIPASVKCFLFSLVCVFYSATCFAENFESLDNIKTIVKNYVSSNIPVEANETLEVDVRPNKILRLAACTQPMSVAFPNNAANEQANAVELSCVGEHAWRILVPINIEIFTEVLVAKRTIAARETITDQDVVSARYNRNHLYSGYFVNKDEVVGQVAKQMVNAGSVITKKNIQRPLFIRKNQMIDLTSNHNGISVSMKGVAHSDGSLSDTIKVYNPASKQEVDAVVVGPNKAEV